MIMEDYRFIKKKDSLADNDFRDADLYGNVKLGNIYIFWKKNFRWYAVSLDDIQRAYRRVEAVDTKMCCGNVNFDIQKLVLITKEGIKLELRIGDGIVREAEQLFIMLQKKDRNIIFGKP